MVTKPGTEGVLFWWRLPYLFSLFNKYMVTTPFVPISELDTPRDAKKRADKLQSAKHLGRAVWAP